MLITEELKKLGLILNSEGFLRLRHCDKNSENFFRYHYYYNCYYSTLISTTFFVHLETQDLLSFIMNIFFEFLENLLMYFYVIFLHFWIISIIAIRTVKISLVVIIIII